MSVTATERQRAKVRNPAAPRPSTETPRGAAGGAPHLVHIFPSFGLGGVPIRIATIMNSLGSRYRHTVIALDGCLDSRGRVEPSVDAAFESFQTGRYGLPATLWRSGRLLRVHTPDLLLTYNWGAVEWGLANRLHRVCPHIHFESGFGSEEAGGQLRRRVLFRRLALARAAHLVMPSRTLVDIAKNVWRIDEAKQRYIPNGVNLQVYAAPQTSGAPRFAATPAELIIGTVAPLRPEKNVARLVRAFAQIADKLPVRLVIAGDGQERPVLKQLSDELGIAERVHFTGMIDDVAGALAQFDVFALSSDTEQMPNSVLQAMAAGCAVVATDVGDGAHMVSPANQRFVVSKDNLDAFSEALIDVSSAPTLRAELGRANRDHVATHYDLADMVQAYDQLFRSAIA